MKRERERVKRDRWIDFSLVVVYHQKGNKVVSFIEVIVQVLTFHVNMIIDCVSTFLKYILNSVEKIIIPDTLINLSVS